MSDSVIPVPCPHTWEGVNGTGDYRCTRCGVWAEDAYDPCHARHRDLTAMGTRRLSWAGLDPVRARIYRDTLAGLPGH